ncbi:MAG: lysophospholipid acyltransferase family protein [Bryobacteraceae bacterium]
MRRKVNIALILRNLFISYPGIILATVVFGTASLVASFFASTGRTQHRLSRHWGRWLMRVSGLRLIVEGTENIHPGGTYVFAANHRSYLDSPIVLPALDSQFRFFAKSDVFYWPLIGFHLKRAGHMPVHYTNPRESLKSMSAAARVIQQKGISVLLFPEAERTLGELQIFKDGAAYVAIKAGVPVVPVGILGSLDALPMGSPWIQPGVITIRIGQPIPTIDLLLSDRTKLSQTMWTRVAELIGYREPMRNAKPEEVLTA